MWDVLHGDCTKLLPDMAACGFQVDCVITDPPYHLASIAKRFGSPDSAPAQFGRDGAAQRLSRGFMGSATDQGDVSFRPETWKAIATAMPPGSRLVCFGGTRTFWRMAAAIEAAGFEYEDTIAWCYGQGLVLRKSRLKPGWEPIMLWRRPGPVQDLNIDDCRIAFENNADKMSAFPGGRLTSHGSGHLAGPGRAQAASRSEFTAQRNDLGRWPTNLIHDGSDEVLACLPDTPGQIAKASSTAPSSKTQSTYGLLRRETKEEEPRGDSGSAARFFNRCEFTEDEKRFLYQPKATASERMCRCTACGDHFRGDRAGREMHRHGLPDEDHIEAHPTVKPIALLRHLVRLVAPKGGLVLDPFAGSSTTLEAAVLEGRDAMGIEIVAEHAESSRARMAALTP